MSRIDPKKRSRPTTASDDSDADEQSRPKSTPSFSLVQLMDSRFDVCLETYSDEQSRDNADDRAWLQKLSEREREAELLKRHEERERLKHQ